MPTAEVDEVNDRYHAFLDREVPARPTSLAARLGLTRRATPRFVDLLRRFVREERDRHVLRHVVAGTLGSDDRFAVA